MDHNLKITAIKTDLISKRDALLVQLDFALNNQNNLVPIDEIVSHLKNLTIINQTLDTLDQILKDNYNQSLINIANQIDSIKNQPIQPEKRT